MIEKRCFYRVRVEDLERVGGGDRESWRTDGDDSDLPLSDIVVKSLACIRRY